MKDLVLLVADKNAQFALKGALSRHKALAIRPVEYEFRVHPGRNGGARRSGPDVLQRERQRFTHALLVFDFEGSGTSLPSAAAVEAELDQRLAARWQGAAKSIVIEPEVDVWMWGSDNLVEEVIGWPAGARLRDWLTDHHFTLDADGKPDRPKEALEAALRIANTPRSSSLHPPSPSHEFASHACHTFR